MGVRPAGNHPEGSSRSDGRDRGPGTGDHERDREDWVDREDRGDSCEVAAGSPTECVSGPAGGGPGTPGEDARAFSQGRPGRHPRCLSVCRAGPPRTDSRLRRAVYQPFRHRGVHARGSASRSGHHRRGAAARRRRRYRRQFERGASPVWCRDRLAGRWGHQTRQDRVEEPRRAAGGKLAQDVPGHGQRHPHRADQTGRPPAQYAHDPVPAGVEATPHQPGNPRHLRAAGRAVGHRPHPARTGGPGLCGPPPGFVAGSEEPAGAGGGHALAVPGAGGRHAAP